MSNLRSVIRDSVVRAINLMLDEERFLHRLCEVIADNSGYPAIAAYVRDAENGQLTLGASSAAAPDWLPMRLPMSRFEFSEPRTVDTETVFGPRDVAVDTRSIVIPLSSEVRTEGVVIVLQTGGRSVSEDDLEMFSIIAEEIAPSVRVASMHQQVRNSVIVDMDTGAFTYEYFTKRLEQELSRGTRTGHAATIVLVEASHFDAFEQAAGYEISDRLLRGLAETFATLLRTSDIVARRGRTGFALLLPDSDDEGAGVTIQRIEVQLAEIEAALQEQGYDGPLPGIIAGSATFPADGQTASELLLAADQRMLADSEPDTGAG